MDALVRCIDASGVDRMHMAVPQKGKNSNICPATIQVVCSFENFLGGAVSRIGTIGKVGTCDSV